MYIINDWKNILQKIRLWDKHDDDDDTDGSGCGSGGCVGDDDDDGYEDEEFLCHYFVFNFNTKLTR